LAQAINVWEPLAYGAKVHTTKIKIKLQQIFVLRRRLISLPPNLAGLSMIAAENNLKSIIFTF
jgi:hypothetical protein